MVTMAIELVKEEDCSDRTKRVIKRISDHKNRCLDKKLEFVKEEDCSSIKKRWEEKMTAKEKAGKLSWKNRQKEKINMKIIPKESCQEDIIDVQ